MELCDVVDRSGNRTGRIVSRGTKLASDEYYLVIHVWIRDEHENYLIQQRALHLESDPGIWATTMGYVRSGEESITGAIREAHEELGFPLLPNHLKHLERHTLDNRVEDVWMAEIPRDLVGTPILGDDVADYKWVSRSELDEMANQGTFFKYSYHGSLF